MTNEKVRMISKSTSSASAVLRKLYYVDKAFNNKDNFINTLNTFVSKFDMPLFLTFCTSSMLIVLMKVFNLL